MRGLAASRCRCNDREKQGARMRHAAWGLAAAFCLTLTAQAGAQTPARINPTDPQPTCPMCPGTYIPLTELESYAKKALAEKLLDQQVRDIDIGKAQIGIGMVHRGKLDTRQSMQDILQR